MPAVKRHAGAFAAFVGLALAWSFPLVTRVSTHVPGLGPGDNLSFLWNFWWMRHALAAGLDPFVTSFLFAPVGADLTLHTHTALAAFAGATVLRSASIVTALNLTILAGLALNGFCAYLLAWRVTRNYGSALLGGLIFGAAPYFSGHLYGHFNLTMAWTIPLVALTATEMVQGRRLWAIATGALIGITAYIDYYYVVFTFALAIAVLLAMGFQWSMSCAGATRATRIAAVVVAGLLIFNAALIVAILVTGGFALELGSLRVSMRGLFNPLQILWILAGLWLVLRFRPRWKMRSREYFPRKSTPGFAFSLMAAAFAFVAAPVVWHGTAILLRGEYVTQRYFWRSAPTGIDAATLLLGNPFHGLRSDPGLNWYGALGIDAIESTAWLGIVPVFLATIGLRVGLGNRSSDSADSGSRRASARLAGVWAAIGAIFFVWSLGSHLNAFGFNTGMILPGAVLRYVPIVSNARIPGRAIVVAYLALSVLAAIGAATWRPRRWRQWTWIAACAAAVVIDFLPSPFPTVALDRPAIYEALRNRPERGSVCELPLGIHDGFGGRGFTDDRTMFYQSIHERPVTGGYISRLPPLVSSTYAQDPLLNALLDLSEEKPGRAAGTLALPDAETAGARLRANGIAFVVLNRRLAPAALTQYVESVLQLELIAEDNERALYAVKGR